MNGAVFYILMDCGCSCIYTFTGTDVKPCLSYLKAFLKVYSNLLDTPRAGILLKSCML